MSNIISYPGIQVLEADDLMLITDVSKDDKPLRSISIGRLAAYIEGGGGTSTSINGESGSITFVAGNNVTIDKVGKTFTINSAGGGGGGGVNGSGTTNSIPVWIGGNTLGDSIITNNGLVADVAGYLSVTTSPTDNSTIRLSGKVVDIVVDVDNPTSGDGAFGFRNAANNAQLIQFGFDDDGAGDAFAWNYTTGGGFKIGTNGEERFRIDSTGNVGIGTASPLSNLHIRSFEGSSRLLIEDLDQSINLDFQSDRIGGDLSIIGSGFTNESLVIGYQANQDLVKIGGSDGVSYGIITVDNSTEKVGIGTWSPSEKLEINGNVKATSFIKTGGTSGQYLMADGSVTTGGGGGTTQNLFETIAVSGQSSIVADSPTDTLTLAAGTGIELTTNPLTDTVTIEATGGGSGHVDTNEIAFFVEWTSSSTTAVNFSPMADWDISGMQWQWNYDNATGRYLLECKSEDWFDWSYRITMSANLNAFSNGKLIQVEMLRISKSTILVEAFQVDATGVQRHDLINTDMRGADIAPEIGAYPQGLDIRIKRFPIAI